MLRAFHKSWATILSLGKVDFLEHFHGLASFIIIIIIIILLVASENVTFP